MQNNSGRIEEKSICLWFYSKKSIQILIVNKNYYIILSDLLAHIKLFLQKQHESQF